MHIISFQKFLFRLCAAGDKNRHSGAVGKQKVLLVHNYKHYFFDPLDAANSVTVEGKVPNLWGPGCGRAGGIVICAGSSLPGNNASSITRIYNIGSSASVL